MHGGPFQKLRRGAGDESIANDGAQTESEDGGDGEEITLGEKQFKPILSTFLWFDPDKGGDRVTVCALMPSGLQRKDFIMSVVDDGWCLELRVKWP